MKNLKTIMLLVLALMLATATNSQKYYAQGSNTDQKAKPCQMSGLSAFLYMDLMELAKDDPSLKSIPEEMKDQYSMREINSQLYVGAFADIKVERRSLAAEYGVFINGKEAMPFMTVNIPVKNYVSFLNSGIADYIEIGEKNYPMMDNARTHTKASIVQSGGSNLNKGYCGKDVIVGVIDIGFDYTHRNLYDSTETTYRVKRVWDQNGSGTPPQGYNYGHLYTTQASILAARYSHNNQTHGMHVVGMAAGGGTSESAMRRFKGMAPESDIVLVATTMSSPDVLDGLRYILAYADSVGKPCVVNMSLGNHVGPHDGKDANEINTDYLFEEVYTEGAALLVSAGNEGSDRIHLSKNFTAQDSSMRTFAVKSDGSVNLSGTVDIWGTVGNNFRVKIAVVDSTSSTSQLNNVSFPLTISTQNSTNYLTATVSNCTVRYYAENSNYNNQKTHVYLSLTGSNLSGRQCMLIKVEATSGTVHMWNNSGKFIGGTAATPGNTNYTSNNKASGNTSIMVASYNTKAAWTTYTNASYNLSSRYPIGGRSYFSSIGPGLNPNQNKPEIAAPGALICSSYNKYDSRYNTSHYMITHVQTTGSCWWGMMQGTSMACPAATGIVALWMEAYPDLSYSQVKYLLRTTAITDSNTGSIPVNGSPQWGWGKINALAGLQTILQKTAKPTVSGTTQFCPGSSTTLSAPTGYAQYIWNTGDTTRTITVSQPGLYLVRAISAEGFKTPWSDTVRVTHKNTINTVIVHGSRNMTICQGQTVRLEVSGNNINLQCRWNTGATTPGIDVSPNVSTMYMVTSGSAFSPYCDKTDTFMVNVQPYVTTNVSSNQTICRGQSATLNVTGGTSRVWSYNNSTDTSITVTPNSTTTYTVTSSQSGRCSKTDSVTVTVQPYVSTSISNDTTVCPGLPITLSVSGGTSRLWNTGATSQSITVTPTSTNTYTVTSSQSGYCSTTDSVTVSMRPYVATTITPDTSICTGSSITLSVNGGTSRLWNTGDTTASITVSPSAQTTYLVTSEQNGYCDKSDSVTVSVKRYVTPMISNDTAICSGEYATIWAGGGDSYYWLISPGPTTQSITVQPQVTTTYMVRIDSTGLCGVIDSVTITVNPLPHLEITGDTGTVPNNTATITAVGTWVQSYLWSTGDTTASITVSPTVPTRYVVVGTSQHGCQDSAAATVVCVNVAIENADDVEFRVYPNPAESFITVEGKGITNVVIYNVKGQIVERFEMNGENKHSLSVKDFAQGLYVMKVENSNGKQGRQTFVVR